MIVATHLVFATGLYLGGSALFEYPADPVTWGITLLFALPPDIDLPTSRIGRPLFWLSVRLERQHGHRTLTHSLVALVFVAGLVLGHGRRLLDRPTGWKSAARPKWCC